MCTSSGFLTIRDDNEQPAQKNNSLSVTAIRVAVLAELTSVLLVAEANNARPLGDQLLYRRLSRDEKSYHLLLESHRL